MNVVTPMELNVELGARTYPIRIGAGLLTQTQHWRSSITGKHVLVVSDETVARLYAGKLSTGFEGKQIDQLVFAPGETSKSLESCAAIFDALARMGANRDACIIAFGGGVIGDLAGFAAACWMRGIDFVQMPTTLLAMVDSSVGGKTGVNLAQGKNLVGAFHQPRAVFIDTDTLATLADRELRAGFAEVIKYGALGDSEFFAWLETHADALCARDPELLAQAIATCCRQKAAIVSRDETEQGERALLNFGHSFGHALETVCGYGNLLHGEAVAIGMCLAADLSARLGRAPTSDAQRLRTLLQRFGLPIEMPRDTDADGLLAAMRLDKKNLSGRLRLILWRGIGAAEVVDDVDPAMIRITLAG